MSFTDKTEWSQVLCTGSYLESCTPIPFVARMVHSVYSANDYGLDSVIHLPEFQFLPLQGIARSPK